MQAVILAAGKGLRLRPLTETLPKGLVPIAGKPLLEHTLASLPSTVVSEIFIVTGYRSEQIQKHFGNEWNGKPIYYTEQNPIDGTGSALHTLKGKLHGTFLVLNGDDLYAPQDVQTLSEHGLGMLCTKKETMPPNEIITKGDPLLLQNISESVPGKQSYLVNCGAYMLDEQIFNYPLAAIPVRDSTEYSLPHTIATMARDVDINITLASSWLPVGTTEELVQAEQILHSKKESSYM